MTESRYQDVFLQAHCLTSLRVQRGYSRLETTYAALLDMTGCSNAQEWLEYFGSKRRLLHIPMTYDMKDHLQHQSTQTNGFCPNLHV
jgi:hypothetical protein